MHPLPLHPAAFDISEPVLLAPPVISPSRGAENPSQLLVTTPVPYENIELGKGNRTKTRLVLLEPYVTYATRLTNDSHHASALSASKSPSKSLYPLIDFVSCHRLSSSQQMFIATLIANSDPVHYKDAVLLKIWRDAMSVKVDALEKSNT